MIAHLVDGPQNRTVASHHNGKVGFDFRQIGFEFQIEHGNIGHVFNHGAQALRFVGDGGSLTQRQDNDTWTRLSHGFNPIREKGRQTAAAI